MRRITMAAMVLAVALGGVAVSSTADAASAKALGAEPHALVQQVQYYGPSGGPRYCGGEGRHHWREHRRARDHARIAEAARREAMRIERERAERRARQDTPRQQYGHYRGW